MNDKITRSEKIGNYFKRLKKGFVKHMILGMLATFVGVFIVNFTIAKEFEHSYTGNYYTINEIESFKKVDLSFDGKARYGIRGFYSFEGTMTFEEIEYKVSMFKGSAKYASLSVVSKKDHELIGGVYFDEDYKEATVIFYKAVSTGKNRTSHLGEKVFHTKLNMTDEDVKEYIKSLKYKLIDE